MAAVPPATAARSACPATRRRPTRWRGRPCVARSPRPGPSTASCALQSERHQTRDDVEGRRAVVPRNQTRGLPKTSESRGTEAILNALDPLGPRRARRESLGDGPRAARSTTSGRCSSPEASSPAGGRGSTSTTNRGRRTDPHSTGAALAAIAVGVAPAGYAASAEIRIE